MDELIINSADNVTISNNLLIVNNGITRTSDIMPLSHISHIGAVKRNNSKTKKQQFICMFVMDIWCIRTEDTTAKEDDQDNLIDIIVEVHNKIAKGLAEYHTTSFKLTKPKKVDL